MISVLLVDDQDLLRAGLKALLNNDPELQVVGEASNGAEALDCVRSLRPDVILMDIRMPVMDGVEATARIVDHPENSPRILILTTFDDDKEVLRSIRAGADGYLLKDTPPEELRRAIKAAAQGMSLLSPQITRKLMDHVALSSQDVSADFSSLTDREKEIVQCVAEGMSNSEIGARLYLSPATARTYVSRILTKLDTRDRTELAILAHRSGLGRFR